MSDDVLSVIPTDPRWQPTREAGEQAARIAGRLASREEDNLDAEIDVKWHETITAVDCGQNLERIACGRCNAEIDTDWWGDHAEMAPQPGPRREPVTAGNDQLGGRQLEPGSLQRPCRLTGPRSMQRLWTALLRARRAADRCSSCHLRSVHASYWDRDGRCEDGDMRSRPDVTVPAAVGSGPPPGMAAPAPRWTLAIATAVVAGATEYLSVVGNHPSQAKLLLGGLIAVAAGVTAFFGAPGIAAALHRRTTVAVVYAGADQTWAVWVRACLAAMGFAVVLRDCLQAGSTVRGRAVLVIGHAHAILLGSAGAPGGSPRREVLLGVAGCPPPHPRDGSVAGYLAGTGPDSAWQELGTVIARRGWHAVSAGPHPPAIRFPGDPPRIWSTKERDPDFTGRATVLATLFRALIATPSAGAPRVSVLQGGPGLGKSCIATEYGHRYHSYYDAVWWVGAEKRSSLVSDLSLLADQLALLPDAPGERIAQLWRALGAGERWLVIFDNVPDAAAIKPWLPPSSHNGNVLITSRSAAWPDGIQVLPVAPFDLAEAVEFLCDQSGSDDEEGATAIAETLGCVPLALRMAAAYVRKTGLSFAGYADLAARWQERQAG